MRGSDGGSRVAEGRYAQLRDMIRQAFSEFLTIPTWIIVGFLMLSVVTYLLDQSDLQSLQPTREFLKSHIFADPQATSGLLSAIAGSLITVTSITFSLLLLAIQQSAASLTSQVFDQFLRRKLNQIYFGFFLGLALFALITLATVDAPFNPVFGATLVLLLTIIALYLLIFLLYASILQMRPTVIIDAIHDHTLKARSSQRSLLQKTRREPVLHADVNIPVRTSTHGFIRAINVDAIQATAQKAQGQIEVVLLVSVGAFVAYNDVIARIKAEKQEDAGDVQDMIGRAIDISTTRDITTDPGAGIAEIRNIAWTSISTARSNPSPGLLAIRNLRDIWAHWLDDDHKSSSEDSSEVAPVVYPDHVMESLIATFESLAVVTTESMQHQSMAEIFHTYAIMFDRLPPEQQDRVDDCICRILSALGDHVLTEELAGAIRATIDALRDAGRDGTATALEDALLKLGRSVGKLNSRSTRVPSQ